MMNLSSQRGQRTGRTRRCSRPATRLTALRGAPPSPREPAAELGRSARTSRRFQRGRPRRARMHLGRARRPEVTRVSRRLYKVVTVMHGIPEFLGRYMSPNRQITDPALAVLPVRHRAVLKLRFGSAALTEDELLEVLPDNRAEARYVQTRTLQAVASLLGITKERVRQIVNVAQRRLAGGVQRTPGSEAGTPQPFGHHPALSAQNLHILRPKSGRPWLTPVEAIRRLRGEFGYVHADFDGGCDEAREDIPHLLVTGASERRLLEIDAASLRAVKVTVSDQGADTCIYLEFIILPEKPIRVPHRLEESDLLNRRAKALGYVASRINVSRYP